MEYFYIDNNQIQQGPFSFEEMVTRGISRTTKVWRQGLPSWVDAYSLDEFKTILPPPVAPFPIPSIKKENYPDDIYESSFELESLNGTQIVKLRKHKFTDTFSVGLGIFLHFLTLGIFTTINCGLKYNKLPKANPSDFASGKAIGYLFIPFFNYYWYFIFWRKLTDRINFQYKLRGESPPISKDLVTASCIIGIIPYVGIISFLFLAPIVYYQIQTAANDLAYQYYDEK